MFTVKGMGLLIAVVAVPFAMLLAVRERPSTGWPQQMTKSVKSRRSRHEGSLEAEKKVEQRSGGPVDKYANATAEETQTESGKESDARQNAMSSSQRRRSSTDIEVEQRARGPEAEYENANAEETQTESGKDSDIRQNKSSQQVNSSAIAMNIFAHLHVSSQQAAALEHRDDACMKAYNARPGSCPKDPENPTTTCKPQCQEYFDNVQKTCQKCDEIDAQYHVTFSTYTVWGENHEAYEKCKFSYTSSPCDKAFKDLTNHLDEFTEGAVCVKDQNEGTCTDECVALIDSLNTECAKHTWVPTAGYGSETYEARKFDKSAFKTSGLFTEEHMSKECLQKVNEFPVDDGAWDGENIHDQKDIKNWKCEKGGGIKEEVKAEMAKNSNSGGDEVKKSNSVRMVPGMLWIAIMSFCFFGMIALPLRT